MKGGNFLACSTFNTSNEDKENRNLLSLSLIYKFIERSGVTTIKNEISHNKENLLRD